MRKIMLPLQEGSSKRQLKQWIIKELQSLVTDYIHEDLQKSYDDIGQIAAFENMSSWNCDVFDEIAEDYPIVLEDTEGWTDEDFADYRKETFIDINNTGGKY